MKKNYIKNVLFFIILILLSFCFLIRGQNLNYMFKTVSHVKWEYTFIGLAVMSIYLISQAFATKLLLKSFGYNKNFLNNFKYACVEFFYSAITPSSTGGQPMELYYMKKDNIKISHGAIVILIELCAFQIISFLYLIFGIIYNYKYLNANLDYFKILLIIGSIISSSFITLMILLLFSKKTAKAIKKMIIFIIKKINLKSKDKLLQKIEEEAILFEESAMLLKNDKTIFIKIILIKLVQITASYAVTYVTALAFHIHVNFLQVVSLQAVLHSSVASIPIPGTIGINEVGFNQIFLPIFKDKFISLATVLHRFMSFYFFVTISGIISLITHIKPKKQMESINNNI